ncbi:putative fatty acid transporter protein [Phaeoacremonium minimum UCRPA7]|uniref:Very long-chain fatty acid transport protein n=1 Tax=Phaeoacremonium minimum (strain UCR-PA7) TaxID=1286976 RepID=R8BSS7_PHAM7|nr:putative fatty acid transporter protein [Phaeoacremonium minimum UCRPA7]EOO02340.1 putative fatty acid transporter protein [Phaeoacremonium minimum UCRPA7]
MPAPLALTVPAAAAGAAYLNARLSLWYDLRMFNSILPTVTQMYWRQYNGRLSLYYDLESQALSKKSADRPFLLFEDKTYSYAQTYEIVLRYGSWLKAKFDIRKGEIVGMDFPNSDVYVFVWLGLWAIGAKPAFMNYNLTGHALAHCLKAAGCALCLVDHSVAHNVDEHVRKELPNLHFHIFSTDCAQQIANTEPKRFPDDLRNGDKVETMALLIYTSGTTGLPKAAMVSWGKLHAAGGFSARLIGTKPGEVYYNCMPLYHSSATIMWFANVLLLGATLALGAKFSTKTFWREARRFNATMILYVGETCRYLLAAPPDIDPATGENLDKKHRVRLAYGNGLRPDVWNKFKDRFGIDTITEFYGATEGSFATWNLSRNDLTMGAVGRNGSLYNVLVGLNVGLVEIDFETDLPFRDPKTGFCREAKSGEPGEFLFRLPDDVEKRFQGYYGNRKATSEKVMRNVFRKGDAWFRTGDVMRKIDGLLYFNDRIGDTFRWKGENVSTAEVSQVIGLHPAVREANVYGVQLPRHDGRIGCAAIVFASEPDEVVLRSLADHVRERLPKYALPVYLRLMKDTGMQTTGTNKQQKHNLRQAGVDPQHTAGDDVYWLRDGTYVRFSQDDWEGLNIGKVKL